MSEISHFERLGLPRRFRLDEDQLEREYLARSRNVHPDHTANDPASLESSAELNEAYSILREPFRRAEYLLGLEGGPLAKDVNQMPAEFLEEMLELRSRIEEVKQLGDPDRSNRLNLEVDLMQRRNGLLESAARQFDQLESLQAESPERTQLLVGIRQTLNATKFIQGQLRDLRDD